MIHLQYGQYTVLQKRVVFVFICLYIFNKVISDEALHLFKLKVRCNVVHKSNKSLPRDEIYPSFPLIKHIQYQKILQLGRKGGFY